MESFLLGKIQVFIGGNGGQRKYYYEIYLATKYATIDDLKIQRERYVKFHNALF